MDVDHEHWMERAIANAARVRCFTTPNPWVGAVLVTAAGRAFDGATQPPGGPHAERVALDAAGAAAGGATLYTTLEPCAHQGRTGPCTDALIAAGVIRVVVGTLDPDPLVAGRGIAQLRAAGIVVDVGVNEGAVSDQLAPYLWHRRTGRPWVVLKLAATLDGRTAAPDGTSQWITGEAARADVHRLRAESDAMIVGAGTVRADDPALDVRLPDPPNGPWRQPRRIVLGTAAGDAKIRPCEEWKGPLDELLDWLGATGVIQAMVEGGASTAAAFHRSGPVNRYVVYLAPALLGGDDGRPLFAGPGAESMRDIWRGNLRRVDRFGDDVRLVIDRP